MLFVAGIQLAVVEFRARLEAHAIIPRRESSERPVLE